MIFSSSHSPVRRRRGPLSQTLFLLVAIAAGALFPARGAENAGQPAQILDTVTFGDEPSERQHSLKEEKSEAFTGGLGERARRLLPGGKEPYLGGTLSFKMKVDPSGQNYFTIRLWGSETGDSNHLILYCDGKQIGYFHLGDVEILDSASSRPSFPGRFTYNTSPLPRTLTRGKTEIDCEIRSLGPIWGYGGTFDTYQKPMTAPTRGIYRVYTHAASCFVPPADEKQGPAPSPALRNGPGPEALNDVKKKLNDTIHGLLMDKRPANQHQAWFLAKAYHVRWSEAYHHQEVAGKIAHCLDALYNGWIADPKTAQNGPAMYNAGWFGFGPAAQAAVLLAQPLAPLLDQDIEGAKGVKRREGWANMFAASRDLHRENRRQYTNQSMINDTYGIYLCNRGVAMLEPQKALPETTALHYLYQSAGLEPWLGSEKDGKPTKTLGENYYQLTAKGLTRELGYVGYYGEVLDWMTSMYDATRAAPGQPGDARIKAQVEKAARARAPFRYPELDPEGYRAMLTETIIGWRDQGHYPGDVTYGQRSTWDASAIDTAAETLNPYSVGYAQQMLADHQFFGELGTKMKPGGLRILAGLLPVPEQYEVLAAQPASPQRLPMTPGAPDFVWSDEDDGCLAVKNGGEILYVSLYWRARYGINGLARVHYVCPRFDRIAVVSEETKFKPSGMKYIVPDWTNMGFGGGGVKYNGDWHSSRAGEEQPIAAIPPGVDFKPGQESVYAGKGEFYQLRYGRYLIGMNLAKDSTYNLQIPAGVTGAKELVSGKRMLPTGELSVGPRSTVVLFLGE